MEKENIFEWKHYQPDIGKLGESVDSFNNRFTQTQLDNVASKIIRDQLQYERHAKAEGFLDNKVQLTFEAMEGRKSDLEHFNQKKVTRRQLDTFYE
ncbi:hypothetical protein [Bacillus wiedmannii]|uniref:hypothetical protein n=1 Tax=Bacillus wiedmannii TaxID=1890302 RepID=UPI001155C220|nr:hypothetical protein [Bacillus wiedmannii]